MMTLAKALKVKNRLIGQLNSLREQATAHNNGRSDLTTSINIQDVWTELEEVKSRLIDLKGKVAVATAPISPKLVQMAELKSELKFIEEISVHEGTLDIGYGATTPKVVTWLPYLTEVAKAKKMKELKEQIASTQDEVDEFNAATKINFE